MKRVPCRLWEPFYLWVMIQHMLPVYAAFCEPGLNNQGRPPYRYPDGGLAAPALALARIAADMGVTVRLQSAVTGFEFDGADSITHVCVASASDHRASENRCDRVDGVVASADYHHVEQTLLPPRLRWYDEAFWARQVMSPSTLLYYLGFDHQMPRLLHHTFFFETDLDEHLAHVFAATPPGGRFVAGQQLFV